MTSTPATSTSVRWPALSGSGGDKEAWVAFVRELACGSEEAWEVVEEQSARIASLEAEVARLRAELVQRASAAPGAGGHGAGGRGAARGKADAGVASADQPDGCRRKTSEQTGEAIRADLGADLSQSKATRRHGVLAMTVPRMVRSA